MQFTLRERLHLFAKAVLGGRLDISPDSIGGSMLAHLWPGSVGAPPKRGTEEFLRAYSTSPWLRAVEGRISSAVASVQWQLYVTRKAGMKAYRAREIQRAPSVVRKSLIQERMDAGDIEPLKEHVFLDAFDHGCAELSGHSVRQLTQIYLDCVGESFWLKERNSMGAPVGFWPLSPHWILYTPTMGNPIYKISVKAWQAEIPSTEILWMRDPDPAFPYDRGTGIMGAAADELDTDEFAAKHTRQFFYNGAKPDFMMMPKGTDTLNPIDTTRLEQDWLNKHQGFWRAFKPLFASRAMDVHEFTKDFSKLQMIELRKHERDMVLQLPGIPPEMLGVLADSNRATIDASSYIFNTQVVVPRLEFLRSELQEKLIPEYDPRLILDYQSPVQEDKIAQLNAAAYAPWSLSVDEWRQLAGQGPLPNKAGSVHMVPLNLVPTPRDLRVPLPEVKIIPPKREKPPPPPTQINLHVKQEPLAIKLLPPSPPPVAVRRPVRKVVERDADGRIVAIVDEA